MPKVNNKTKKKTNRLPLKDSSTFLSFEKTHEKSEKYINFKENKEVFDCFFEAVSGALDDPTQSIIDKDVNEFLLADMEQKLTEILQESKKVMRHSKRHVLTT